jgi:hypothetical protein
MRIEMTRCVAAVLLPWNSVAPDEECGESGRARGAEVYADPERVLAAGGKI